jgi:hypothetical protein
MEHANTPQELQDKYGLSAAAALAKIKERWDDATKTAEQPQKFRVLGAADARPA